MNNINIDMDPAKIGFTHLPGTFIPDLVDFKSVELDNLVSETEFCSHLDKSFRISVNDEYRSVVFFCRHLLTMSSSMGGTFVVSPESGAGFSFSTE